MAARQGTLAPHQLTLTRLVCPYLGTTCTCLWKISTLHSVFARVQQCDVKLYAALFLTHRQPVSLYLLGAGCDG